MIEAGGAVPKLFPPAPLCSRGELWCRCLVTPLALAIFFLFLTFSYLQLFFSNHTKVYFYSYSYHCSHFFLPYPYTLTSFLDLLSFICQFYIMGPTFPTIVQCLDFSRKVVHHSCWKNRVCQLRRIEVNKNQI